MLSSLRPSRWLAGTPGQTSAGDAFMIVLPVWQAGGRDAGWTAPGGRPGGLLVVRRQATRQDAAASLRCVIQPDQCRGLLPGQGGWCPVCVGHMPAIVAPV